MKKFVIAGVCSALLLLASCTHESVMDATGKGVPSHCSHVEFWNGGTKIYEGDNVSVQMRVSATNKETAVNDVNIRFYIYTVTDSTGTTNIIDSEALAILWR